MKSKEALKEMCKHCESKSWTVQKLCPFRSISNDYCEEYETILKELEVLEFIKENCSEILYYYFNISSVNTYEPQSFLEQQGLKAKKQNLLKIKEWLENGTKQ